MLAAFILSAALGSGLQLAAPTPGVVAQVNTLVATGATPGGRVFFFYAFYPGVAPIPGCTNQALLLQQPVYIGAVRADAAGAAQVSHGVPPSAQGFTIFFQAAEPGACAVSNRVKFQFQ